MNEDALTPQRSLTEDEARAELEALVPRDASERKRTFSALLRAVIDDRHLGV